MKSVGIMVVAAVAAVLPQAALGWGQAGHEVIAAEAWRQLSPELRATASGALRAHPDFAKWQAAYQPNSSFDADAYIFIRCSTWPDEIHGNHNRYDHPNWHFIDYPLRPPDFKFEPGPKPKDDVLYGLAQCESVVANVSADPELRAAMLSYMIHLVGDIHQPMHCASLFDSQFPRGDKGGNNFFIMPASRPIRLHGFWDGALGSSANPRTQWNYAIELQAANPRSSLPELAGATTPRDWSLASRQLAIDKAYLHGELRGSTDESDAPPLPAGYTTSAKNVAEHQAVLAGYRLADELQKFLRPGTVVPVAAVAVAAPAATLRKITADQAAEYYGKEMTVMGRVAQASVRGSIAFLNLDKPFPNSPFAAVIFQENLDQFGDLQRFRGHRVEISGRIKENKGKPEIVLESPSQVKVDD